VRIREAVESDRGVWDDFVDSQGGMFHQYLGWKNVYAKTNHHFIPVLAETDRGELLGIFSVIRQNFKLYSVLSSFGFRSAIVRQDLPHNEKAEITRALVAFVEKNYSRRCSAFIINEQLPLDYREAQNQALIDSGFRVRWDRRSGLPCSHVLPLKTPFEEHIWKGLWSQKFRQALNKVAKNGVKVVQDREFKYAEQFADLVIVNYERHKTPPPAREFVLAAVKEFGPRMKIFVALNHDQPVAYLSCIYTRSTCYLWEIGTYTRDTDDVNKYCYKVAIEDACNSGYQFVDFLGAYTKGLSDLKKRFGTQQTPIIMYEKRYAKGRVLTHYVPEMAKMAVFRQKYLWANRAAIWDKILRW
jgi:hypothetical protein